MNDSQTPTVSVLPYVLAVGAVKIACAAGAHLYFTQTGNEPGSLSTPVSFLAAGVALWWYSHRVNRPMQRSEMLWFASGAAFVDFLLSCLLILVPILWVGASLTMSNVDIALGGDGTGGFSEDSALLGMIFLLMTVFTFLLSLFLAWSLTRKLPRRQKAG